MNLSDKELEKLIQKASEELLGSVDDPPPPRGKPSAPKVWVPDLNKTQIDIWDDPAKFILAYGEKGSGKSIVAAYKGVRHCYENENALLLIITPSMRAGNEGIWFDLDNLVLPAWKDGIGLEYTDSKLDPNTKDRHRWIRNRFGGWSKLLLMSVPYSTQIEARIKGPAPSMIIVDELTNCDGVEYFRFPAAQLGRRRGIHGPQQFIAACNPAGPSHWVYQTFFVDCVDQKSGARDPRFKVYHVPITENKHRLPAGYYENLESIFRSDPVEYRRLIHGEWIDRPTGEGLFKDYFSERLHVRGDAVKGYGLKPFPGFPILVGYDLGQVYSSVTFLQLVPTESGKNIWIIFDEIDHLGEKILYKSLAKEVIGRMEHWKKLCDYEFQFMHITDESAINQWRPGGEGSYDAWDFEREFNKASGKRVKMVGCPKGAGSVPARIRLLQSKLYQDEVFVSATCKNTKDMLMSLESDKDNPDKPRRGKFIHKFDSVTYPMFKTEFTGMRKSLPTGQVAPSFIRCGSNQ